jgi:hypothetical protein
LRVSNKYPSAKDPKVTIAYKEELKKSKKMKIPFYKKGYILINYCLKQIYHPVKIVSTNFSQPVKLILVNIRG